MAASFWRCNCNGEKFAAMGRSRKSGQAVIAKPRP
jgi:hypothetical protein